MPALPINQFLSDLQALESRGFSIPEVHQYLASTRIEYQSLERYLYFRTDRYSRNLVFKNNTCEVLVLCWRPGQSAPVHGHEGQYCWARVETGALRFTNYKELSLTPLILEKVRDTIDGPPGYLDGPSDIHKVANPSSFPADAVSLHVYCRPFLECDIYDLKRNEKRRIRLDYDTIDGQLVRSHRKA